MRGTGKAWAYAGAVFGGSVSVAANVAHSYVPPEDAIPGWQPKTGAVLLAAFWPMALLVAVEIMARVAWPRQLRWMLVRFLGMTPVAVVAAVVSYQHLSGLLDFYDEDGVTVGLGPLAVDGLMVISTGALLALAAGPAESRKPIRSTARSRVRVITVPMRLWPSTFRPTPVKPISQPLSPQPNRVLASRAIPIHPTPIGNLSRNPIPDPIPDPIRGLVADPIEAAPGEPGDGRLLVLADRVARHSVTAPTDEQANPDDLTRVRLLIKAGTLPRDPSAEKIMAALKPCGPKRARTIRDAIKNQNQKPTEDPQQGSDITQVPETGPTTARREIH